MNRSPNCTGDVRKLARLLGWSRTRVLRRSLPSGQNIFWFEAAHAIGNTDLPFLQINPSPQGQSILFTGAVYAVRYRLCSGWHEFRLPTTVGAVARLKAWLGHEWFAQASARKEYRQLHPECTGYSWKRISTEGVPTRTRL